MTSKTTETIYLFVLNEKLVSLSLSHSLSLSLSLSLFICFKWKAKTKGNSCVNIVCRCWWKTRALKYVRNMFEKCSKYVSSLFKYVKQYLNLKYDWCLFLCHIIFYGGGTSVSVSWQAHFILNHRVNSNKN